MRPIEYDDNAIIEAGKDLEAEGRPVTGYALRKRVGGGSPDRLRATWDDWVSKQAANDGHTEQALPVEIVERLDTASKKLKGQLTALVAELHGRLNEISAKEIEAQNERAKLREQDLRNELADAGETLVELEERAATAHARIDALQIELMAATAARQAAEVQHAEVAAQKGALSESLRALQAAALDADAQLSSLKVERNDALRAASAAREELAHSNGKVGAMHQQIKELLELVDSRSRPAG